VRDKDYIVTIQHLLITVLYSHTTVQILTVFKCLMLVFVWSFCGKNPEYPRLT